MKKGNRLKKYKYYLLIHYVAHIEGADQMGCMMGGLSHFYIDSKGNVNPCVLPACYIGNVSRKMNSKTFIINMLLSMPHPLHKECPSLLLSKSIIKKAGNGIQIPISVEHLADEWSELLKIKYLF